MSSDDTGDVLGRSRTLQGMSSDDPGDVLGRSRGCPRTIHGCPRMPQGMSSDDPEDALGRSRMLQEMSSDDPGDVLGRSRALGDLPQQSSSACRTQLRGVGSGVRTTDRCWWWSAGMISFLTTLSKSAVTTTVFRAIFHYTDFTETSRVK